MDESHWRSRHETTFNVNISFGAASTWGKQSGGHINPAMTFAFYWLGKIPLWDALLYGVAQFSGATSGVALATFLLRGAPGDGAVRYAVTAPGEYGAAVCSRASHIFTRTSRRLPICWLCGICAGTHN
jgi:glycerol uptake facilitator-like aquaporin